MWTYPDGTSPWPELLSEKDGDYLAVNITNVGSGNMTVTKADCEEVFSRKPTACSSDDKSTRFEWSYRIGEAKYSIEYVPDQKENAGRVRKYRREDTT